MQDLKASGLEGAEVRRAISFLTLKLYLVIQLLNQLSVCQNLDLITVFECLLCDIAFFFFFGLKDVMNCVISASSSVLLEPLVKFVSHSPHCDSKSAPSSPMRGFFSTPSLSPKAT